MSEVDKSATKPKFGAFIALAFTGFAVVGHATKEVHRSVTKSIGVLMTKRLITSLLVAGTITAGAQAATFTPLPDDPNMLIMQGEIEPGDSSLLYEAVLAQLRRGINVDTMILNSPGGLVEEGIGIANYVHLANLITIVPREADCSSMCVLIFAAGKQRLASPMATIGVHSILTYEVGSTKSAGVEDTDAKVSSVNVARQFADYGTPAVVIGKMIATPGTKITDLTTSDLEGWATVVDADGGSKKPRLQREGVLNHQSVDEFLKTLAPEKSK